MPTWRGFLVLLALCGGLGIVFLRSVHPFLEITERVGGDVLVAEGWCPDFTLREAGEEYDRGGYRRMFVTGGPIEKGAPFFGFNTYAELGAEIVGRFVGRTNFAVAVPAPAVRTDRTFASALALKRWLAERGPLPEKINVLTTGPHARRTRLLFQEAFGSGTSVGIIAVPDDRYDANRWWTSSDGFRTTTSELIAYLYARLLFRPSVS
jgi:hypothetical protein